MAKVVQSGGQACDDQDAAACLAQGHPKSGLAKPSWGMKDRDAGAEGLPVKSGAHDPYAGTKTS
jgi:hypothetical protein